MEKLIAQIAQVRSFEDSSKILQQFDASDINVVNALLAYLPEALRVIFEEQNPELSFLILQAVTVLSMLSTLKADFVWDGKPVHTRQEVVVTFAMIFSNETPTVLDTGVQSFKQFFD